MVTAASTYDGERLSRLVQTALADELSDALDTVEARWAATVPVTLPDPVTYQLGFNPVLLEKESVDFPIVAVIPGERVPEDDRKRVWGAYQKEAYYVDIHYFVVADTIDQVNLICYRYTEAIVAVLQAHRVIGSYEQLDWKPEVELGIAGRHPKAKLADLSMEADTDYVVGGRVTIALAGG